MKKKIPLTAIRVLLVTAVFAGLLYVWFSRFINRMPVINAVPENGTVDLQGYDLQDHLVQVTYQWDYYPYHLYTSADFKTDGPVKKRLEDNTENVTYGTYHLIMKGSPNTSYLMYGYSMDYGTKIYVNGNETIEVGKVADSADKAVGCANTIQFPVYFDQNGNCELIAQFSNFVHNEGGVQRDYLLGTAENIINQQNEDTLSVDIISCGLLLLGAYYALYACVRLSRVSLCLAACCFVLSIRNSRFFLGQLLPLNYDWNIFYRVIVIDLIWIAVAMLELLASLYPKMMNRWIHRAFLCAAAFSTAAMFLVSSKDCVSVNYKSAIYVAVYLLYMIFCLIRYYVRQKHITLSEVITLAGFTVFFGAELVETYWVRRSIAITHGGFSGLAMVVFIMLMMSAASMKERETEAALIAAQEQMASLQQVDSLKTEFFKNMAHEIKTPLTVTSGYAQRTKHRLQRGINDETNIENLDLIQEESERLADMVNQMLKMSLGMENQESYRKVNACQLIMDVAAVCRPLLAKNNNALQMFCEEDIEVKSNHDILMQVLINLATNANRYTKDGIICFEVKKTENAAVFRVIDNGTGIKSEILEHIFETGVQFNGETGRGLAIAKGIIEKNGGIISVEHTDEDGTSMMFTIPLWKDTEDEKEKK